MNTLRKKVESLVLELAKDNGIETNKFNKIIDMILELMPKELDITAFNTIRAGDIIGCGIIENSSSGIYMTNNCNPLGGNTLKWIAVKGYNNDWTIYCHWSTSEWNYVRNSGDKIQAEKNIRKLVPCTDEVFNKYRH